MDLTDVTGIENPLREAEEKPKGIIIQGTLKNNLAESNTQKVIEHAIKAMPDIEFEVIHMAKKRVKNGLKINLGDDMAELYKKVEESKVVILASPIWWNAPSSFIQRFIERTDEFDKRIHGGEPDKPSLGEGKIMATIITGDGDGAQAVSARIMGWATLLGFTCPPYCTLAWFENQDPVDKAMKDNIQLKMFAEYINLYCRKMDQLVVTTS